MQIQKIIKLIYLKKDERHGMSQMEIFAFVISSSFIQGRSIFFLTIDSFHGVAGLKAYL